MALHLVGETINKTSSHYRSQTGKLVQLMSMPAVTSKPPSSGTRSVSRSTSTPERICQVRARSWGLPRMDACF